MEKRKNNYRWLDSIPSGWRKLTNEMIKECEAIDPNYKIYDLKEKWGALDVNSNSTLEIFNIELKYERQSSSTCCICGEPAIKN